MSSHVECVFLVHRKLSNGLSYMNQVSDLYGLLTICTLMLLTLFITLKPELFHEHFLRNFRKFYY